MRAAVAFLTPFGGARTPDARTFAWFPIVGAALGALVGLAWWGAAELWPPLVVAALVVALDLGVTGMLHLDGLVDSADGLLPHLPRDRRLAVMAEPTVGAFALAVAGATLLLRYSAIGSIEAGPEVVALVAGLWCASRSLMAVTAGTVPYARPGGGLASAFAGSGRSVPAALGLVLSFGLGAAFGWAGVAAVAVGLAAGVAVVALGRAKLGGYTGDVLGAAGVIVETVGLLVASARW